MPLTEDGRSPAKKKFKGYPIGYLHVDFAEVQTEEGRVYLFVAIDRTSKVAFAELQPRATKLAPNITCAFPVAVGEDNQLTDLGYTFEFVNQLAGPKAMSMFKGKDHAIHGSRASQLSPPAYTMVADWLTDRVRGRAAESTYTEVDATGLVHEQPWGDNNCTDTYGLPENTRKMVFGS